MPRTDWGWQVTADEIESWTIRNDESLLVLNKPAHLVCHPSKKGPWSSLIGACREFLQLDRLHLISRLDRETSGVILIAKDAAVARQLNIALQDRATEKAYLAIMEGSLLTRTEVTEPIGRDFQSAFVTRQWVASDGQPAATTFVPMAHAEGYTFARVHPISGRRHQIRVHAAYIGHSVVGDKLYGPDETIMQRFITDGFTADMEVQLKLDRQALHAYEIAFPRDLSGERFVARFPEELARFWWKAGGSLPADLTTSASDGAHTS